MNKSHFDVSNCRHQLEELSVKKILSVAVFVVCALPVTVSAQGGMGGGMSGGGGGGGRGGMGGGRGGMGGPPGMGSRSAPQFPTAKKLEELNPAELLIEKQKKLKLADSTVVALGALRQAIFERNSDLMSRYDSLQHAYRPPTQGSREDRGAEPDSTRRQAGLQMQQLRVTLDQLSERRRTDMRESLALVPETSREEAAKLLDKQDGKFTDLMPVMPTRQGNGREGEGRRGPPDQRPPA